jgi:hypothetical protein
MTLSGDPVMQARWPLSAIRRTVPIRYASTSLMRNRHSDLPERSDVFHAEPGYEFGPFSSDYRLTKSPHSCYIWQIPLIEGRLPEAIL